MALGEGSGLAPGCLCTSLEDQPFRLDVRPGRKNKRKTWNQSRMASQRSLFYSVSFAMAAGKTASGWYAAVLPEQDL